MSALERRLRWYWPMEAANAILLPGAAFLATPLVGGAFSPALIVSAFAAAALLGIGAIYLRAIHQQSLRNARPLAYWVPVLAAVQVPAALIVAGAVVVTGFEV